MFDARWNRSLDIKAHAAWMKVAATFPGFLDPDDDIGDGIALRNPTADEVVRLAAAVAKSVPAAHYFKETRGGGLKWWTPGSITSDGRPFAR